MQNKPVATSTEAGRAVASNALANRQRIAREEAEAKRADTTTPLTLGKAPLASIPEPPAAADDLAPQQATLVISVTILHRGRLITIASEGRTLDAFCDLLDKRFGVAQ